MSARPRSGDGATRRRGREPGARERRAAEAVRRACLDAFRDAWEDAALRGLCGEGAVEVALDAVRRLDLEPALREADDPASPRSA